LAVVTKDEAMTVPMPLDRAAHIRKEVGAGAAIGSLRLSLV
jgi:hypothetical protein